MIWKWRSFEGPIKDGDLFKLALNQQIRLRILLIPFPDEVFKLRRCINLCGRDWNIWWVSSNTQYITWYKFQGKMSYSSLNTTKKCNLLIVVMLNISLSLVSADSDSSSCVIWFTSWCCYGHSNYNHRTFLPFFFFDLITCPACHVYSVFYLYSFSFLLLSWFFFNSLRNGLV